MIKGKQKTIGSISLLMAVVIGAVSPMVVTRWIELSQGVFLNDLIKSSQVVMMWSGVVSLLLALLWAQLGRRFNLERYPENHYPFRLWYLLLMVTLGFSGGLAWWMLYADLVAGFYELAFAPLLISLLSFAGVSWIRAPVYLRRVPLHSLFKNMVA